MKPIAALTAAALALSPVLGFAADPVPQPVSAEVSGQTTGGVADKTKGDDEKLGLILTPEGAALGAVVIGAAVIIALIAAQNGDNNAATNTN